MQRYFIYIRFILQFLVFVLFCLAFAGFASIIPIAQGAFIPAFISGTTLGMIIFWGIVIITCITGRAFYCSIFCPLGFLQDVVGLFCKKKPFIPHKSVKYIKYFIAGFAIAGAFIGNAMYPGWFEPYTIVAKNLSGALRNFLELILYKVGIRELPEYVGVSLIPAILAGAILLIILLLCFYKVRFFCNVLCPAGTILGVLARKSRIGPIINDSCVKCGKCMVTCPAGCIDINKGKIDYELCIGCSKCIATCKLDAISWSKYEEPFSLALPKTLPQQDNNRRDFLATFAAGAVSGVVLATGLKKHKLKTIPAMPPGAGYFERFTSQCTACGLCIANCTGKTLVPSLFEYGPGGMGQPMLSVKNGYCNYNCTKCMDVCPAGALIKLPLEQKRRLQIGRVTYYQSRCVVVTDKTSCGACAEHCPVEALEMVPYGKDGLTIPKANPDICLGCGACEYICPVKPLPAVEVKGVSPQVPINLESIKKKTKSNAIPALQETNSTSSKGKEEPIEEFPF